MSIAKRRTSVVTTTIGTTIADERPSAHALAGVIGMQALTQMEGGEHPANRLA
jgi:hypothetical protein